MLNVTLKTAVREDSEFVFLVKKAALGPYIEQTWGWDETFQRQFHDNDYDPSETSIIVDSGRDVGWMVVTQTDQEFHLRELYLHPDSQGRGIGSHLIKQLLAKAKQADRPVRLTVLKVNTRARQLYQRLGFKDAGETDTHYVLVAGDVAADVSGTMDELHDLRRPQTPDEWQRYHEIRRRVLWERRGHIGVYDENHPDEHKVGHYPFLLMYGTQAAGVIRIDIDGAQAIFRRVAVREDMQRAGHGRVLLKLAEKLARENGCDRLYSFVSPDAVGFYEKCGFQRDTANPGNQDHVPMEKRLASSEEA